MERACAKRCGSFIFKSSFLTSASQALWSFKGDVVTGFRMCVLLRRTSSLIAFLLGTSVRTGLVKAVGSDELDFYIMSSLNPFFTLSFLGGWASNSIE